MAVCDDSPTRARRGEPEPVRPLTPRMCQVLELMCQGLTNAQIARSLGSSPHTVKQQLMDAERRLSITNTEPDAGPKPGGRLRVAGGGRVLMAVAWMRVREAYLERIGRAARPLPEVAAPPPPPSDEDRLWQHIDKRPETAGGCWVWLSKRAGAPYFTSHGHRINVRRYLWGRTYRPLPPSVILWPTCSTLNCVNPDHVRPSTPGTHLEPRAARRHN